MALRFKRLSCRIIDVKPGFGQVAVFRLSGQRKVPVLVDGEIVIPDSSEIIRHLEHQKPMPSLIPNDPTLAAQVHLIEDWADTTLASQVRSALLKAVVSDPSLRLALLPEEFPDSFRQIMSNLPCVVINNFNQIFEEREFEELLESLQKISSLIESNGWLVGNQITIADIATAAQLSLLLFPSSSGSLMSGKGVPGFRDNPCLENLFRWRDHIELEILQMDSK